MTEMHTHVARHAQALVQLVQYLSTQPFNEVEGLIAALRQAQPVHVEPPQPHLPEDKETADAT